MEANATSHCDNEDQDEYVLLDLDGVSDLLDIPPNANYVLTGLDTLNPVLIIDDRFKLVFEEEVRTKRHLQSAMESQIPEIPNSYQPWTPKSQKSPITITELSQRKDYSSLERRVE
ncbi:uncharacterized protein LOC130743174 isoform X2 [Lotus japonicus]|uniref:uncharacterized protein LOC130743174 isoform X2 n=1 Tax=Lotus japonicus TaxID=34305 RepID=UPI00258BBFDD|nr:uncharacterized protein LOC130743174 isoform X2 [Lotus japonicus]